MELCGDMHVLYTVPLNIGHVYYSVLSYAVWGHACPIYSATEYRICPLLNAVLCSVALRIRHVYYSVLSYVVWGHACPIYSATKYRTCPLLSAVLCSVELRGDMHVLYTVPLSIGHVHCSMLSCAQWHCG